MALSTYLANKLLDHSLRNTSYTPAATVYLALFTTMPDVTGAGGVEVGGGSYVRKAVTFAGAASGVCVSSAPVVFTGMPAATVVGAAIYDASVSGNMLMVSSFAAPVTVAAGTDFTVPAGDVTAVLS